MKTNARLVLFGLTVAVITASACQAGSIWMRANRRNREVFADDIAREIGDILNVIIDEQTTIETETNRGMDKSTSRSGNMRGSIDFEDLASMLAPFSRRTFDLPKVDFSSSAASAFDGGTDYDTDRSMDDQIPVIVEDVLPNGNLVVLGSRTREYAGDVQIVQVSGVVRPTDISFDNSVSSGRVANFHIVHKTIGQENTYINPGWLTRLANILNPF